MANPAFTSAPQPAAPAGTPLGASTVDEGVRLASTGRTVEARACFERILRADPRNSDACNNLGVLHMQAGDPDDAIALFERALKIKPLDRQIRQNCIQANFEHGQMLTLQTEHVASIERYRRTLALDPDNIGARMNLTNFYDNGAVINNFLGADWSELKSDAKRDYIIDHVMPWYVGFYASWRRAAAEKRLDCRFVTYEDMIADKPGTLMEIAEFLGLEKTLEDCRTAIASAEGDRATTRFNKGVAGRGADALSDQQQAHLRNLATPFGSIDFSPIGL